MLPHAQHILNLREREPLPVGRKPKTFLGCGSMSRRYRNWISVNAHTHYTKSGVENLPSWVTAAAAAGPPHPFMCLVQFFLCFKRGTTDWPYGSKQVPSKKLGLGARVPGGSSHTEPEEVRLEPKRVGEAWTPTRRRECASSSSWVLAPAGVPATSHMVAWLRTRGKPAFGNMR